MDEIHQQRSTRFGHGRATAVDFLAYDAMHVSFVLGYRRLSNLINNEREHLNVQGRAVCHHKLQEIPEVYGSLVALVQQTHRSQDLRPFHAQFSFETYRHYFER